MLRCVLLELDYLHIVRMRLVYEYLHIIFIIRINIVKYVLRNKTLLVLAYLSLVIVLISVLPNAGNLVTQITLFGEPKTMIIKQYDLPLYKNIERHDIISSRIVNSTMENKKHDVENIVVEKGQEFTISLESNPTTGYQWIPMFNTSIINLISHSFQPSTTKLMGSPGTDIFNFKGINYGTESLKMVYKRSWEKMFAKEKVFVINVR
jgi:predicted secreted protein